MTAALQFGADAALREPSGIRRAALLAHALAEPDRAWLLGALDPVERRAIAPLVDELDALGVERASVRKPPKAGRLASAPRRFGPAMRAIHAIGAGGRLGTPGATHRSDATSTAHAPGSAASPSRIARDLASLPVSQLAARFEDEPDAVVLDVLALADAPAVRRRALRAVDAERRGRLAARLVAGRFVAGARARALEAAWSSLPEASAARWPDRRGAERLLDALRSHWRRLLDGSGRVHGAVAHTLRPLRRLDVAGGWRTLRRRTSGRGVRA